MLTYRAAGHTDAGNVKELNQDSFLLKMGEYEGARFLLAVVADGMGGVMEGELASKTLTVTFGNWAKNELKSILMSTREDEMEEALAESWDHIILDVCIELNRYGALKGYEEGRSPGSTLCVMFLFRGKFYLANIGDSRIYRCRKGRLTQMTEDHSWAQEAKNRGYSQQQINDDYRSNMITKCVGAGFEEESLADYYTGKVYEGDVFLLCTDGLRRIGEGEEASEGEWEDWMTRLMEEESLDMKEKTERAVQKAMDEGETDNITAVMVSVSKG